jgi:hypothetical protein
VEVVVSLSQGRPTAAQCGLFTQKSVPVISEPPSIQTDINKFKISNWRERSKKRADWEKSIKGMEVKVHVGL